MVRKDWETALGGREATTDRRHTPVSDMEQQIMWEVHVLQELGRHEHIVRVIDVVDLVDATYIVMSRVNGPELTEFLHKAPSRRLEQPIAVRFVTQLLLALDHAHSKGFVHCDIKPQNVRLNSECDHATLTDWGYAERVGSRSSMSKGTPAYAPPEQLTGYSCDSVSGRRDTTAAVDVWSLGVTLFQLLSGELPFGAGSFDELVHNVLQLSYRVPDHFSREVTDLIEGMLQVAPCDRATIKELLASPLTRQSGALPSASVAMDRCGLCEGGVPALNPLLRRALIVALYTAFLVAMLFAAQMFGGEADDFDVVPDVQQ